MSLKKRGLMNSVRRFWNEDQGSITIQVLTFSFLLLATTGLVLDSGRLYTQHSQLQAFTDQMALAAANELDGQPDALERAAKAVFGQNGDNPYLRKAGLEQGEYSVSSVYFFEAMAASSGRPQNDMRGAFPAEALVASWEVGDTEPTYYRSYDATSGPDGVSGPEAALYAVLQADEAATKSSMVGLTQAILNMGSDPTPHRDVLGETPEFGPDYGFGAVAAASIEERTCAELSTLVFCNPWEDVPSGQVNPLEQDPDDPNYSLIGRSLMHFAGNYSRQAGSTFVEEPFRSEPMPAGENGKTVFGSAYTWDLPHQLFTLQEPIADEAGVCADVENANSALRMDGDTYEAARTRCLLARAQADQVCWGEDSDFVIQPAHGPDVVRGLNTAYDIWHEPFKTVLESRPATDLPGAGIGLHQAFEPDRLAVTLFELADWYGDAPGTEQDGSVEQEFADSLDPGSPAFLDAFVGHLIPHPEMRYAGSNFVSSFGRDVCHTNTYSRMNSADPSVPVANECTQDFVGNHYVGNVSTLPVARGDMNTYWGDVYGASASAAGVVDPEGGYRAGRRPITRDQACTIQSYLDTVPGLAEYCGAEDLPEQDVNVSNSQIDTWYEVYRAERLALDNPIVVMNTDDQRTLVTFNDGDGPNGLWTDGLDDDGNPIIGPDGQPIRNYIQDYGLSGGADEYVQRHPDDYYAMSAATSIFIEGRERRRIRAAMVNCQATAVPENLVDDENDPFGNEYKVAFEDLRVLDMYLPHPALFHCGTFPEGHPNAGLSRPTCDLSESADTVLYSEVIRDVTDDVITKQFIAKLVR